MMELFSTFRKYAYHIHIKVKKKYWLSLCGDIMDNDHFVLHTFYLLQFFYKNICINFINIKSIFKNNKNQTP